MNKNTKKEPKKNTKKELNIDYKKIILISIIVLAISGTITFLVLTFNNNEEKEEFKIEGIDIASNKDILKDTKVDTLEVTNQVLYNRDNMSNYSAIIKNDNTTDYNIKSLYVVFTVNDETIKMLATEDSTIKANNQKIINISFDKDILSTTKIEFIMEK